MKREMRILAMLACLLVAACAAIVSNHSIVTAAPASHPTGGGSLQQPCHECIVAMPGAEAVGVESMPQISVPHTALSRTGRVQQLRTGSAGGMAVGSSRNVSQQRRTASGSVLTSGVSSPVCFSFMRDYYVIMLRRIVI